MLTRSKPPFISHSQILSLVRRHFFKKLFVDQLSNNSKVKKYFTKNSNGISWFRVKIKNELYINYKNFWSENALLVTSTTV